jgi:hypothetical protein
VKSWDWLAAILRPRVHCLIMCWKFALRIQLGKKKTFDSYAHIASSFNHKLLYFRWLAESEESETFHAFHGSRLDNWHSILHHGLQQHR